MRYSRYTSQPHKEKFLQRKHIAKGMLDENFGTIVYETTFVRMYYKGMFCKKKRKKKGTTEREVCVVK